MEIETLACVFFCWGVSVRYDLITEANTSSLRSGIIYNPSES